MLRYSTPTIEIESDISFAEFTEIWVSFKQNNVILRKTKSEIEINETIIKVRLSQEETAMFKSDEIVEVQIRWLSDNGSASGTNVVPIVFGRVLEDEVIKVDSAN